MMYVGIVKFSHITVWLLSAVTLRSVLWHCWLGGRKGIRPVKTDWWGAVMVICLGRGAGLHMAQLMPLPLTVSCSSKSILVIFLVLPHPCSPGQRAIKQVSVCHHFAIFTAGCTNINCFSRWQVTSACIKRPGWLREIPSSPPVWVGTPPIWPPPLMLPFHRAVGWPATGYRVNKTKNVLLQLYLI